MNSILFLHPEGNINNNPSLSSLARRLNEAGYQVDVVCQHRENVYQQSTPWYRVTRLRRFDRLLPFLQRAGSKSGSGLLRVALKALFSDYLFIFGVDRDGIIAAHSLSEITKAPYALISYEIFFAREVGREYKEDERKACGNLSFAICQDEVRSRHLSDENAIPLARIMNVPVSAGGRTLERSGAAMKAALNIPAASKVALYMGTISDWSDIDDLVGNVHKWPADWVLLLHNRYKDENLVQRLKSRQDLPWQRIYLSSDPFPEMDDLYNLVSVADLGLAFYKPTYADKYSGDNLKYIGLSSGKVAMYLQCGVPVVINEVGLLSDTIKGANAGYVVDGTGGIHGVLGGMSFAELPGKMQAARSLYEGTFSLDNHSDRILCKVAESIRESGAKGAVLPIAFRMAVLRAIFATPLLSWLAAGGRDRS